MPSSNKDKGIKMKIKSIIGSILLSVGALAFVSAPSYAGECSAEDPCLTYAMVNDAGTVTNIIVCQPSVCGSGTFAGSRVVPQVASNPVTHESQAGYLAGPNSTPITESNGRFTITNDSPVVHRDVIKEETTKTVFETAVGPGTQKSFTFEDTVGAPNGVPTMRDEPMKKSTKAKLSATDMTNDSVVRDKSDTSTVLSEESFLFNERETEQFVELTLQLNNLQNILRNWTFFKLSLVGWFL